MFPSLCSACVFLETLLWFGVVQAVLLFPGGYVQLEDGCPSMELAYRCEHIIPIGS